MRKRENGFTLVELLAVMAIAAILLMVIGAAWTSQGNSASAAQLSRKLLAMLRQARAIAVESNVVTQVRVDTSTTPELQLLQASLPGFPAPGGSVWTMVGEARAEYGANFRAADPSQIVRSGAVTGALPICITFRPDGSATSSTGSTAVTAAPPAVNSWAYQNSTIFMTDQSLTRAARVLVYGMTGYSRSLEQ